MNIAEARRGRQSLRIEDENGNVIISVDGLIQVNRGNTGSRLIGHASHWHIGHEFTHAVVAFAREVVALKMGDDVVKVLQAEFGNGIAAGELFNEEEFANAFGDYMRNVMIFGEDNADDDKGILREVFEGIDEFIKALLGAFGIDYTTRAEAKKTAVNDKNLLDKIYRAVRDADFVALSGYINANKAKIEELLGVDFSGTGRLVRRRTHFAWDFVEAHQLGDAPPDYLPHNFPLTIFHLTILVLYNKIQTNLPRLGSIFRNLTTRACGSDIISSESQTTGSERITATLIKAMPSVKHL